MKYNRGFSLIEIILALGVSVIVFVGVFHFAASVYVRNQSLFTEDNYFSYTYGEPYCPLTIEFEQIQFDPLNVIDLSGFISTSTKVSSMYFIDEDKVIITTDSASTTESDIFMFKINTELATVTLETSKDVGPGIQDAKFLDLYMYVANTSVNSHVKTFKINLSTTGTEIFKEISNSKIPSLALSASLPKKLAIYNSQLIVGSEKSSTGPEVFVFDIERDGTVVQATKTIELDGQMNQAKASFGNLYIANASDPELKVYDALLASRFTYDAPLTLGNGKSILHKPPYIIFGRTLGSGELSLLQQQGTTTIVQDIKRTNGTVDFIQDLGGKNFLSITANEEKEMQFWNFNSELTHIKDINVPGRVMSYTCAKGNIFLSMLVQDRPKLIWLHI